MEDHLTTNERMELETLEGIIAEGMGSFIAVGNALLTIRDQKLYREKFKSFNAYCTQRWLMQRRHADRLICGSQVAVNLETRGSQLCSPCEIQPIHEQQVRPPGPLKPEQLRERISLKNFWADPIPGGLLLSPLDGFLKKSADGSYLTGGVMGPILRFAFPGRKFSSCRAAPVGEPRVELLKELWMELLEVLLK